MTLGEWEDLLARMRTIRAHGGVTSKQALKQIGLSAAEYREARTFFHGVKNLELDRITVDFVDGGIPGRPVFLIYGQIVHDLTGLWAVRRLGGFTVTSFAAVLGKSVSIVSQWHNAGITPPTEVIVKCGQLLRVWADESRRLGYWRERAGTGQMNGGEAGYFPGRRNWVNDPD